MLLKQKFISNRFSNENINTICKHFLFKDVRMIKNCIKSHDAQ